MQCDGEFSRNNFYQYLCTDAGYCSNDSFNRWIIKHAQSLDDDLILSHIKYNIPNITMIINENTLFNAVRSNKNLEIVKILLDKIPSSKKKDFILGYYRSADGTKTSGFSVLTACLVTENHYKIFKYILDSFTSDKELTEVLDEARQQTNQITLNPL